MSGHPTTRHVPVQIQRKSSIEEVGDKIVGMLDEIEKRVEHMRDAALHMEQEKESLLEMLSTIRMNRDMLRLGYGDREDIEATCNRLLQRTRTVDVQVVTPRNTDQERALETVNSQIDTLVERMKSDLSTSKQTCARYLAACEPEQPSGPIDLHFQAHIIECAAEDQKKTRRRLQHLNTLIDRAQTTIQPQY